jgi:uncharacterized DUF497 family protein
MGILGVHYFMPIEFDAAKNATNIAKHGVDFEMVDAFEWDTAVVVEDTRREYGETRLIALGYIGDRLHVLAFTIRDGNIRPISLRKANSREIRRYAEA